LVTVKVPSNQAYRYLWSTPNGEIYGSPNGSSTLARKEGNYNVVVEEVSSGCTEEASVQVIYYAPVIDSVQYDVIPPGCLGGPKGELKINRIYGGTPPFSSYLSNSSSLQRLELTTAGPQILILIDSLGCKKEFSFVVPEPVFPSVALGNGMQGGSRCEPSVRPARSKAAAEKGVPLEHHAAHLIIHGLLHLAGHDHVTSDAQAEQMEALETAILAKLGIADPYDE
jgi:hypothetical protein